MSKSQESPEYPEVEVISRLMQLVSRYGVEELHVEEEGLSITLRSAPIMVPSEDGGETDPGQLTYLWQPAHWTTAEEKLEPSRSPTAVPLTAPLTGHFYRARTPDAPPLASVGDIVEKGQSIGLIEAMKVFSDVEAEVSGTVVEVVHENGKLVSYGDVLMYVEPTAVP